MSTHREGGSAGSNSSRHQHRSKVIKEVDFKKFNPSSPVHYACLRSNGKIDKILELFNDEF